jgi:hypothetical protein
MGSVVVGALAGLLGVVIGFIGQWLDTKRKHRWQQEAELRDTKRLVYTQFLRSIAASYTQARAGKANRPADRDIREAADEIELLSGPEVSNEARRLTTIVITTHDELAKDTTREELILPPVNDLRYLLIDLFKEDLQIKANH